MEGGGTKLQFDSATYRDVLFEYIDAATPERLRLILREVYDEVPEATEPLMFKLVANSNKDRTKPLSSGSGQAEVGGSPNTQTSNHVLRLPQDGTSHASNPTLQPSFLKRAPEPHIDTCVQCKRDFDTQTNTRGMHFPSRASVWDDWWDGDGERDIPEYREEYQQVLSGLVVVLEQMELAVREISIARTGPNAHELGDQ